MDKLEVILDLRTAGNMQYIGMFAIFMPNDPGTLRFFLAFLALENGAS